MKVYHKITFLTPLPLTRIFEAITIAAIYFEKKCYVRISKIPFKTENMLKKEYTIGLSYLHFLSYRPENGY